MIEENPAQDVLAALQEAAKAGQEPPIKGLIDRLTDTDKKILAHYANAAISEPSQEQRDDESYRHKVANMNAAEYAKEVAKLK